MSPQASLPLRSETVLFVGAGATAALDMPTTDAQAGILWRLCDGELPAETIESTAPCFVGQGQSVIDLLNVVDPGVSADDSPDLDADLRERAFPGVDAADVRNVVANLRRHYDWSALKLVAKAKKGGGWGAQDEGRQRENYLQEVFTLIDACLREERGFQVYAEDGTPIFLSVARLRGARELLILLINTMFASAWKRLIASDSANASLPRYREFFASLARLMQKDGIRLGGDGVPLDSPAFYKFGYSIVTTNFEPILLWLVWKGHYLANHERDVRVGNPGRQIALRLNFTTTVGMRSPETERGAALWLPCTEAAAQSVNSEKHLCDRAYRLGLYSPVHGMTTFRHCPMCGRLNLYLGDTWEDDSSTLFPNGIIHGFRTGQCARTVREEAAQRRGEYDALECHFCGAMTHSHDNFMFMQTQLKCAAPSFIKEMTDDSLAQISGAKHIVLLGYSLPLDDAIWGSLFTAMTRRANGEKVYCSAVLFAPNSKSRWLMGDELEAFIKERDVDVKGREDVRALKNIVSVFGKDCVRAYMAGVPGVFGDCEIDDARRLLFPTKEETGWDIPEFSPDGVVRRNMREEVSA